MGEGNLFICKKALGYLPPGLFFNTKKGG